MSKKNVYRVEYRPIRNFSRKSKNGDIGDVSVEVKAYDINEAMDIANKVVEFNASDPHEISAIMLMYRPCVECDEDGD